MKLSESTLSVLKNFSTINSGVVLQKGKSQKTISPDKSILVEAELEDDIPVQFGIYDLPQFLGNVTTLQNPDLSFQDNHVVMNDGQFRLTYYSCSPNLISVPPDKKLEMKNVDVAFGLSSAVIHKLLMLSRMNNFLMVSVIGKDGKLSLRAHADADTSNDVAIEMSDYSGEDFTAKFKTEHIKMVPDDYNVKIAFNAFATFENQKGTLKYYVALQSK